MEQNHARRLKDTVIGEIRLWNRAEANLLESKMDPEEAAKDPGFVKFKLKEFDRIYFRYRGDMKKMSLDEEAHMSILMYHRNKMRKILYPSRLGFRRFLSRIGARIGYAIDEWRYSQQIVEGDHSKTFVPNTHEKIIPEQQQQQNNRETQLNAGNSFSLGKKSSQDKSKGLSL